VRIDERIKGLLFLLFMALQILTLMDFVASGRNQSSAGVAMADRIGGGFPLSAEGKRG
jgi:transposase